MVKFNDELVLFMSHHDIERKLDQLKSLDLELEIERGQVEPMRVEQYEQPIQRKNEDEIFTIVLDKQRGIYHPAKN